MRVTTANVTAVRLLLPAARRVTIDGHTLELPSGTGADTVLRREGSLWAIGAPSARAPQAARAHRPRQ